MLNVLGAGDAFLSGYLSGWIEGLPAAHCGRRGNAAGAIVVTRHGCTPAMPTRAELDEFLGARGAARAAGHDARIARLHRATTARRQAGDLCILAFDHRRQVEQLAAASGADYARIADFKALVAEAVLVGRRRAAAGASLGAIVDGRHGGRRSRASTRAAPGSGVRRAARARVRSSSSRRAASGSSCLPGRGITSSSAW